MSLPGHGTSNRARLRRFYRENRTAGMPFVLAHKLAKARLRYSSAMQTILKLDPAATYEPHCECCGPEVVRFTYEGKRFQVTTYLKPL